MPVVLALVKDGVATSGKAHCLMSYLFSSLECSHSRAESLTPKGCCVTTFPLN